MQVAGKYGQRDVDQGKAIGGATKSPKADALALDSFNKKKVFTNKKITSIRFPIRLKVILPYLILAFLIAMAGAYILTRVVLDTVEERFTNQLIETRKLASECVVQEEDKLLETLRLITHTNGTAEAVAEEDSDSLRDISYPLLLNASVETLEIIDISGTSLLSLHHRAGGRIEDYDVSRGGTSIQEWDLVKNVLDKKVDKFGDKFAGIVSAPWGDYLYVSGPLYDHNQELAGVILVGNSLVEVAQGIREATLSQVTIYDLNGQEINTTFLNSNSSISQEINAEIVSRQEDESFMRERVASGIAYQEILAPLEVRSGADIGFLGTSLAQTFLIRASSGTKFQIFSFTTISFLFLIAAGIFIADQFTRPLLKVVDASSEVADGNLDIAVIPTGNDEVTALTQSFNKMVSSLQHSKSELIQAHEDTIEAYDRTIEGWCKALELRDNVTEGHTYRVTDMTVKIARHLGFSEGEIVHVRRGALMHDIGKMAIPDSILKKPGALTDDEWQEMRKHPVYAYDMLHRIAYLKPSLIIPYCHHEKWDGTGYPRGLKGEEIPLEARIFAIADVWDALSSERPYRSALPTSEVFKIITESSGSHFEPRVVNTFLGLYETILSDVEVPADHSNLTESLPENFVDKV
jgi:HD-GYP domain-containing protein (c-di-GMP phosphodiesterase class II)